jgi:MFS family permease
VLLAISAVLFRNHAFGAWGLTGAWCVIFFFASAGASSAYLTVSEIFPVETRALAIAFFYAVGTGVGGITGPLLFGNLIGSGKVGEVATGFFIGAGVMAIGGIAELLFGVRSEQRSLEDIATPLSAGDGEAGERPARPPRRTERYRPGPGRHRWQTGMSMPSPGPSVGLEREAQLIAEAVRERGSATRLELERAVGARRWGPGRFGAALRLTLRDGRVQRAGPSRYRPAVARTAGVPHGGMAPPAAGGGR